MTDGAALLRAVIAQPAEDTPRLVYADWLDENGDPDRAAFVRGQCALADMELWDDGYTALDVRCRQLERAHPEWLGPLVPFVSRGEHFSGDRDRPFARGFPARVELTPAQFAEHRRHLFTETPVREIEFKMEAGAGGLSKRAGLSKLTGAEFAFARDPSAARAVLACLERLGGLKHFGLIGSILGEKEAGDVFASAALAAVESLTIMGTRLPASAEAAFAALDWPDLRRLLRVWVSQLDWLRAPWVNQLEELTIYDTEPNLSIGQRRLLADVLPATAIKKLSLGWWALDAAGGRALGEAVARSRVRSLALAQTSTSAEVAGALVTPAVLAQLRALYFSWAELDAEVIGRLAGSRLRVCALDHITCDALAALGRQPGLPELTDLRLGMVWKRKDDPFAERLRALLEAGTLPRLVSLTLCDTTPHRGTATANWDRIATALAACPAVAGLRELQLDTVTGAGARALANSPHLNELQLLNVHVWPKRPRAERALTARFGTRVNTEIVSREY